MLLSVQTGGGEMMSYGWMAAQVIIAMTFIIVLAVVSLRFLLPKIARLKQRKGSGIEILDFQPLEHRKTIYLVKIEDKKVAVASSENNVAKLCEWDIKGD
ncbi:MAG: FliO/MopB family protein [Deltaproteobacteria bacterium]|nr:FliO/MopB family protein [Deltaproteobacteria bacterium]